MDIAAQGPDPLTARVIGSAIEVHRLLGPGLLESAYLECLCHELYTSGISFTRETPLPLDYKGIKLDCGYRMDLVVEHQLVVELKSVDKILPLHKAQLLTYLKLSMVHFGLLINFNTERLREGITRLVWG
jgi:GxxExxY protein